MGRSIAGFSPPVNLAALQTASQAMRVPPARRFPAAKRQPATRNGKEAAREGGSAVLRAD